MSQENPRAAKKEGLCHMRKIWMMSNILYFVSDGAKGFGGKKISVPQFKKKDEGT